ncbi:Putative nitroreductase [Actinoplanes sp. SE50]|uniref:nitroreductase n=1 Tax=unclassified Actinoplanes TaxID=2626549 RepID=UPI00023EC27A|nr:MULTISPECIES: nitroreductase [unclassified Actinoplanes]AEV84087.1 Putative nitroreductase [Actinoplanes sp. SE50/110]ATO82479.1 Putative nitroreductase [Actinoplanes sp. SE50]SLL99886.1 nitroreductase [Actinoplanes sp. SE50/110]
MIGTEEATRNDGRLSAAYMAYAVASDPQFTVPRRPCLIPGLVVVRLEDGLAFAGSGNRQTVLRGRTAMTLIPRLLRLLDGTRTVDELPEKHAAACVSMLYVSGLLQDGPAGGEAELIPAEVVDYLGRNLDTTRVNRSRGEAAARLARTRALIAGPERLTGPLRAELAAAGVDAHPFHPADSLGDGDFVVAVDDGNLAGIDEACRRAGVGWLRTAAGASTAEIGPMFDAGHTSCLRCFAEGRTAPAGEPSPARAAIWAALTATEVVHLLSRVGLAPSTAGCTAYDLDDWSQTSTGAYRRPGCPRCLPGTEPAEPALAHVYEQAVAFPPREWLNPKDHQAHFRPANAALQRYNKEYRSAPRIPLADAPFADLAGLLLRTAGLKDAGERVTRWAPTGGNLGSVQAYLRADDVPGLDPGWYFYQRGDHSLARIAGPSAGIAPALEADRPAALIVLTGALPVVAAKYHDFSYRLVCLDAGAALAQLSAVAAETGLATRIADRWDDQAISAALRIDAVTEPVTAVVAVSRKDPS